MKFSKVRKTIMTTTTEPALTNVQNDFNLKHKSKEYKWRIVWRNVIAFLYFHVSSIYAFYLIFSGAVKWQTIVFTVVLLYTAGLGLTAGAHRLWSHRSYRARWPLRLFLMIMNTISFQNHVYEWARDHRVHHKFTETDADPHNARRGFFFSHMGWLMIRKHKDVFEKGATIDMSDLEKDPIVMFQKKTYPVIMPLLCFLIPAWIPVFVWHENTWYAWNISAICRYTLSLHITWLLNSVAHIWGTKPYDKTIFATDIKAVAIITGGEGWHNYHHVFPWDYKAGELGNYGTNLSTAFIDLAAKYGLAYDLKSVSNEMIRSRVHKTGDGTHPIANTKKIGPVKDYHNFGNMVWGWDDEDLTEDDRKLSEISHTSDEV